MARSQPQVDFLVNLPLLVPVNPGLHAGGMSPLGKVIKARLQALGQTQSWLAERVGVSEQAVSKWMSTGKIARKHIKDTADALQISAAQLLSQDPNPEADEWWHSLSPAVKLRLKSLHDVLSKPPAPEESPPAKPKRRA